MGILWIPVTFARYAREWS